MVMPKKLAYFVQLDYNMKLSITGIDIIFINLQILLIKSCSY